MIASASSVCHCVCVSPLHAFSGHGAHWFREKGLGGLSGAIDLVKGCRRIAGWSQAPWMLENTVGVISSYWREPDYSFDPCDYGGYLDSPGDAYTKKTCLWTGGGFVMQKKKRIAPLEGSKMHRLPPSADRGDLRSVTPLGFVKAVKGSNATRLFSVLPFAVETHP